MFTIRFTALIRKCRISTEHKDLFRVRKTWARAAHDTERAKRWRYFVQLVPRFFLYSKANVRDRYLTYTSAINEVIDFHIHKLTLSRTSPGFFYVSAV